MQLHTIRVKNKRARKVRVGRGGKRGSFSGRGIKGQKARAGRRIRPEVRDFIMKMPKRRGHRQTMPGKMSVAIRAAVIAKKFQPSERVNPKTLVERGLVRKIKGRIPRVKLLGPFEPVLKYSIQGVEFSRQKSGQK